MMLRVSYSSELFRNDLIKTEMKAPGYYVTNFQVAFNHENTCLYVMFIKYCKRSASFPIKLAYL